MPRCRSPCGERGLKCRASGQHGGRAERRSPCGERGLKCADGYFVVVRVESLPVRGAWIEIFSAVTDAWKRYRRSPCGERGLK